MWNIGRGKAVHGVNAYWKNQLAFTNGGLEIRIHSARCVLRRYVQRIDGSNPEAGWDFPRNKVQERRGEEERWQHLKSDCIQGERRKISREKYRKIFTRRNQIWTISVATTEKKLSMKRHWYNEWRGIFKY